MFVPSAFAVDPNPSYQDKGDFYLTYEPTYYYQEFEDWLKLEQYFESQIPFLNETFKLPYDVEILIGECGESNAFYFQGQIIICYELIRETDNRFADFFNISQRWKNMNFGSYKYSMHLVRGWTMAKSYVSHLRSKLPTAWFSTLLE